MALLGAAAFLIWGGSTFALYFPELTLTGLNALGLGREADLWARADIVTPSDVDGSVLLDQAVAVLFIALLAWGALALGWRCLGLARIRVGTLPERLAASLAVGLGAIAYLVAALALVRLMRPAVLVGLLLLLAAHAAVWTARREWREGAPPRAPRPRRRPRALALAAWGVAGLLALATTINALGPDTGFDAHWYHLTLQERNLDASRIVAPPEYFHSLFPQTAELLYAIGLAWDGVGSAKLVHLLFGALAVAAAYLLARRIIGARWAVIAAVVALAAPTFTWEMTTSYVDLVLAALITLVLIDVVAWRQEGDRRRLWRAALLLGLTLAVKNVALLLLPPLLLAIALARPAGTDLSRRAVLRRVAGVGALALVLPLPWYIRSAIITGDPIFPSLYGLFGAPADRWNAATDRSWHADLDHFGLGRGIGDLVRAPWDLLRHPDRFEGSIGALPFMLAPFALLRRPRRPGLAIVATLAVGYIVIWASPISSLQGRFLVPVVPALAVLSAAGVAALTLRLRAGGLRALAPVPAAVTLVVAVLSLPSFMPWHSRGYVFYTQQLTDLAAVVDGESRQARLAADVTGYTAIRWANRNLPDGTRYLSTLSGADVYSRFPKLNDYTALALPAVYGATPGQEAQALAELRRLGITHVIIDWSRSDTEGYALTGKTFRDEYLDYVYDDPEVGIYAVPPVGAAPGDETVADVATPGEFAPTEIAGVRELPDGSYSYVIVEDAILVYAIDRGHRLVRRIALPEELRVHGIRGVAADAVTDRLYVSYFGGLEDGIGNVIAYDLEADRVLWRRLYEPSIDSMAITPDGRRIYMPCGEDRPDCDHWLVLDATTGHELSRIPMRPGTHNTIVSLDGRRAYLASLLHNRLAVVDTGTDRIIRWIGPFGDSIRPFTIDRAGALTYVTVDNLSGFEVGDLRTGERLHRVEVAGFPVRPQDHPELPATQSHGIALTPDEREVWVVDAFHRHLHVFDTAPLPGAPPRQVADIALEGLPKWINFTRDGRYAHVSSGEIIDARARTIVATVAESRQFLEIEWERGEVVQAHSRYGLGYGRVSPPPG